MLFTVRVVWGAYLMIQYMSQYLSPDTSFAQFLHEILHVQYGPQNWGLSHDRKI